MEKFKDNRMHRRYADTLHGGLSRGQYIVYINNGMNVYSEKFNNK